MLLSVDVSVDDTRATVSPVGEIDLSTVTLLTSAVSDAMLFGAEQVLVDLDRATYIDSAGLGALVGTQKRLRAGGGALVIRCREPRLLRLFTITGLSNAFTIETAIDTGDAPIPCQGPSRSAVPEGAAG